MSHLHRFYIPSETPGGEEILLTGEEAHHAIRVVRVRPGEAVALFDGAGREIIGRISTVERQSVRVRVETDRVVPQRDVHLTLIQAWLKRDKHIEEIIRHGTELGVARFVFYRGGHSEKAPEEDPKWMRLAIEACKQCGRLWIPEFVVEPTLAAAVAAGYDSVLVATRDMEPVPLEVAIDGRRVAMVVGPEGDFTDEELDLLRESGGKAIGLGPITFRSEVAAVVGCTLVLYELGELGARRL